MQPTYTMPVGAVDLSDVKEGETVALVDETTTEVTVFVVAKRETCSQGNSRFILGGQNVDDYSIWNQQNYGLANLETVCSSWLGALSVFCL